MFTAFWEASSPSGPPLAPLDHEKTEMKGNGENTNQKVLYIKGRNSIEFNCQSKSRFLFGII